VYELQGLFLYRDEISKLFSGPPTESFCLLSCRHVKENLAIQRMSQVSKRWVGG